MQHLYRYLIVLGLASLSYGNSLFFTTGLGYGIHSSVQNSTTHSLQSHWHVFYNLTSPLYEGMDGRIAYELSRGNYINDYVADDHMNIEFRAKMSRGRIYITGGFGLGVHHRQDYTIDEIFNQAYIPLYIDVRFNHAMFAPLRLSVQGDYYINTTDNGDNKYFNPVLNTVYPTLYYRNGSFEYAVSYQISRFSQKTGIQGLNNQRVEGQIIYHFNTL